MTDRAYFSDEEWWLVMAAPYIVAIGAVAVDMTVSSLIMELASFGKIIKETTQDYRHVALIQALAQDIGALGEREKQQLSEVQLANVLDLFSQVLMIVDLKAEPEEAQEYRYFLYEVGEKVTQVAGEGWLGLGPKTSDREYDFLTRLEEWLGI